MGSVYISWTEGELLAQKSIFCWGLYRLFHVAFSVSLRALDDLSKILIMSKFICTLVLELIEMIADSNFWCSFTDGFSISRYPEERESRRKLKRKDRAELSWAVPPRSSSGSRLTDNLLLMQSHALAAAKGLSSRARCVCVCVCVFVHVWSSPLSLALYFMSDWK